MVRALLVAVRLESRKHKLTGAERRVLALCVLGERTATIGPRLGRSVETVRTQVSNLIKKTGDANLDEVRHRVLTTALRRALALVRRAGVRYRARSKR